MKLLIFLFLLKSVFSDAVCDERLLIMELKQDLEDNGVLDCLRVIRPPHSYDESIEEKNKRIAAQWDTACAFEADYDWMKPLREIHGISNLVDDTGDIVDRDFPDQADMCEIVRAAIASGKFSKITTELVNIPLKILDLIDCPGSPDQSEICAVTGSSYFQNDTWYILLDGMGISINNKPQFVIAPVEASLPDIPEVQRDLLKGIEKQLSSTGPITDFKKNLRSQKDKLAGSFQKIKNLIASMNTDQGAQSIIILPSEKTSIFEYDPKSQANTVSTNQWNIFGNTLLKIKSTEGSLLLVVSSSTVNFVRDKPSHFVVRLMYNGIDQKDARSLEGNSIVTSVNTGFITKTLSADNKVHLEYRSPGMLTNNANNPESIWQDNRYIGALLLSKNLKHSRLTLQSKVGFEKSSSWLANSDMKLKFSIEVGRPVLILYALSLPTNQLFAARLTVNGAPLTSTYKVIHSKAYAGLFGMGVKILDAGNSHEANLEYMSGAKIEVNSGNSDWQSAGISMMELPITTIIHERILSTAYTLTTGKWDVLGNLKIDLKADREKNCLIFYSVSSTIPETNWAIYTRVTDNDKEIVPSRSSSSNSLEFGISLQFVVNLKPGKHTIQLEHFTGEKDIKIDPNVELQKATLTIVEMEAETAA